MTDKEEIFSDERSLELPPGYRTVKLQIQKLKEYSAMSPEYKKINEIIDFINKTEITITGNEEFLEKFKDWIV